MPHHTRDGVVPWPPEDAARFRAEGYWEDRPLAEPFFAQADAWPDRTAIIDGDQRMTYGDLAARVDGTAQRLLDLGIVADDRILVQLPNCAEFVIFVLACFRTGAVPVMALPAHRSHELTYLAELSESVAIVVPDSLKAFDHQALAEQIRSEVDTVQHVLVLGDAVNRGNVSLREMTDRPPNAREARSHADSVAIDPDGVACFLLSGGTTGLPKLIARTHNDYVYNVRATSAVCDLSETSVYLVALPASHNFPLACPGILGVLFAGGTMVSMASPEPEKAFAAIRDHGVTHTAAVPAVVQRWIEYAEATGSTPLGSLSVLQVGGSRIADEVAAKVKPVLGATLQQVFGMAEGLINTTRLDDPLDVISTTQGRPVSPADEVKIVGIDGATLPAGHRGVLLTRGPYTPRGYYRAPEHNARSFTSDGWYITGDIVDIRPDGNLVVQGREKDMINRGGEKISGEEVENLVYRHDVVDLAAAVAMPDPVLGERVCVYVTLKRQVEFTLEEVRERLDLDGVARFKHPERLVIVDNMPLTKVGKIDKKALRDDIQERVKAESE